MKLQTKAVDVLERTANYLKSGVLSRQPAWYNVIAQYPPNKNFLREPKTSNDFQPITVKRTKLNNPTAPLYETRNQPKPGRNIYKPRKLNYIEDELRSLFYEQHPWELSRPKILLENSGDDASAQDWSSIKQINKALDGESVVQRTLYILQNEKLSLTDAYDKARFELYRVRIEQEVAEQISAEENEMFGAVYTKTPLEHGVEQEQKVIDKWRVDAEELTRVVDAKIAKPEDAIAQR